MNDLAKTLSNLEKFDPELSQFKALFNRTTEKLDLMQMSPENVELHIESLSELVKWATTQKQAFETYKKVQKIKTAAEVRTADKAMRKLDKEHPVAINKSKHDLAAEIVRINMRNGKSRMEAEEIARLAIKGL
jgi:hypothetical protein